MKKIVFAMGLCLSLAAAAEVPFKLGVARYTMHKKGHDKALEILQSLDCHYFGLIDNAIARDASDEQIAAFKANAAKYGVEVITAGPLYCENEEQVRALFTFAKRYGMKSVSVVPFEKKVIDGKEVRCESEAMLDIVEKYIKEFDIRAGIHNHGPDIPYLFPTAESVWARIKDRDERFGFCLDVGHQRRAGKDPVAAIKAYSKRIFEIHLKNIKIDAKKNLAMPGPRGELDIPAILRALADVGFDGPCLVEYERDFDANELPLAESLGYYRGVMDSIKAKAVMKPAPENANTLTDAEKAEGWELLFDGVKPPADKFVGVSGEWKCEKFPTRGWVVREKNVLTVLPQRGIADGKWFPLAPEDAKLGGAGDIVTKKFYRDFRFKFDFRLTEAANSGIKYFHNEKLNKGSCEEYQIMDKGHPDQNHGHNGDHRVASLYDLIPANADEVVKPLGEWNHGEIVAKGNHVEHWLNGVKVVEYERGGKAFREAVAKSKYATWGVDAAGNAQPWGELPEGRILIQDHSDSTVSFCNLKIKEL